MALVQRGQRQPARRIHLIGIGGDFGQRLLDALELADGQAELVPHPRVGAGRTRRHGAGGGGL